MLNTYTFTNPLHRVTVFHHDDDALWLNRLFGMPCGRGGSDDGPARTQGLVCCSTSLGRFEKADFHLEAVQSSQDELLIAWKLAECKLSLESHWNFDPTTGVISRRDRLVNLALQSVTLYRYFARFTFSMRQPEVYSQHSAWIEENQGCWTALHHGKLELANERGRSTCGGTPFFALRECESQYGAIFHLLPTGNWLARIYNYAIQFSQPYTIVELGISDEDLRLVIPPGEAFEAPEILIQPLEGEIHFGVRRLHAYLYHKFPYVGRGSPSSPNPFPLKGEGDNKPAGSTPIVYNTWFYQFDRLEVPLLRQQLQAAKELGCEVFVIDAGWYGPQGTGWWQQAGDWREKTDTAFAGRMAAFADEVRSAGLGFGLWMEPERFAEGVPILQEHPEWFVHAEGDLYRIDLENPAAYTYLKSEISRLIETYGLAWMKVDFNFELGVDPTGAELYRYYQQWYRLLDELKLAYPNTFFEGCSSGGMRCDIQTVTHFGVHFLSDTVNPTDVIRLTQGAWLRLPPGWIARWCVLRSAGNAIPRNIEPVDGHWPATIVTPQAAGWEVCEAVDVNFAVLAALPGAFGLSGEVANLPEETRLKLKWAVDFYKSWRYFISRATGHLLTPLGAKEDRTGWVALQLDSLESTSLLVDAPASRSTPHSYDAPTSQSTPDQASLLFVYRLSDRRNTHIVYPQGLKPGAVYRIKREDDPAGTAMRIPADELIQNGLAVSLPQAFRAALYSISIDG